MKVFVWQSIDKASERWHPEGGLVVFAETIERAIALANEAGAFPRPDEFPDEIRECEGPEKAYVMEDAGCC